MPSGTIAMYGGSVAPGGWLSCDGSAVSRTTYAALFAAIGTAWGTGDGSTTFNLPDLRGRAPVGSGQGGGLTNRALAATGGEEAHALSTAELAAHTHGAPSGSFVTSSPGSEYTVLTAAKGVLAAATASTGSGTAHNTMPPFAVVGFIIQT